LAITAGSAGSFQFDVNTITGLNYVVQTTTNLVAPVWTSVLTNNTGLSGAINYQTNAAASPARFFRLLFP